MISKQSMGGIARGINSTREALERIEKYNSDPKLCKHCLQAIKCRLDQKLGEVLIKSFCNHSCATKFNNNCRIKKPTPRKCSIRINVSGRRKTGPTSHMHLRKKGELFGSRSSWQSARSSIRKNAALVWKRSGKRLVCEVCGYDLYVEIAHIKSVSDFPDEASLQDINAIDNLKALCPNHHWEFDNLK